MADVPGSVIRPNCGLSGPGHQPLAIFLTPSDQDALSRTVLDLRAVGDTGVQLDLLEGPILLHDHDNACLRRAFLRRTGPALLDQRSVLRIPFAGGGLEVQLAQEPSSCPVIVRRADDLRRTFYAVVRDQHVSGHPWDVHRSADGALAPVRPDAADLDVPLSCTTVGPGHCINRFLDYKMIPALWKAPVVASGHVEAGNRIVLRVQGVPHVLHHHRPWELFQSMEEGVATHWAAPWTAVLVSRQDGRAQLFRVTPGPLSPCEDSQQEASRYRAVLSARLRDAA